MSDLVFETSSGERIPVVVTTRRGLRNITLRPRTVPRREICISKPWLTPQSAALRFLERKRAWVERIFARAPQKVRVYDGMVLNYLGRSVVVHHDPTRRGNCYSADGMTLYIGGGADMFERRLRDVIKQEFMVAVRDMVRGAPRELWPRRIALRDTTSRWGSCSSTGTISFSWRLAFAPTDVMRYVVMHELAHRRHMDHSPEFWAFVRELYGFGVERAKRWLATNGAQLHQYL
ncbi:MAG: M48 family metallopeptidase [Alphaproteobacteria bacterium]|nr:M48 family metallopeptidase [Alphaproteobacteria bacterium]